MNAIASVILSAQVCALVIWLSSLVAGKRFLGAYKPICAAFALTFVVAIAAPALRSWMGFAVVVGSTDEAGLSTAVSAGADDASNAAAPFAERTASLPASLALIPKGSYASVVSIPAVVGDVLSLAGRIASALSAFGLVLLVIRLGRYARWAARVHRESSFLARAGRVEYRCREGLACSFGLARPTILLPEAETAGLEAMRLHEEAHLDLGHQYWNFLQAAMTAIFWFNPLFALIEAGGRKAREIEADEAAARVLGRVAYADSLVRAAASAKTCLIPAFASSWEERLVERVRELAEGARKRTMARFMILPLAALLCLVLVLPISAGDAAPPSEAPTYIGVDGEQYIAGKSRVIRSDEEIRITTGYGDNINEFTEKNYFHRGIDLFVANDQNAEVIAWDSGTVSRSGNDRSYGVFVEIAHSGGYTTFYAHLERSELREGDKVVKGEEIGAIGRTGIATGPHLHFELKKDGISIDPMPFEAE